MIDSRAQGHPFDVFMALSFVALLLGTVAFGVLFFTSLL